MDPLVYLILTIIGLYLLIVLVNALQLSEKCFKPAAAQLIEQSGCPADVVELLKTAEPELTALGFEYSHCLVLDGPWAGSAKLWHLQYVHRLSGIYASVSSAPAPESWSPLSVWFIARYADAHTLLTVNGEQHEFPPPTALITLSDHCAVELKDQWEKHYAEAQALQGRHGALVSVARPHAAGALERMFGEWFRDLETAGMLQKTETGLLHVPYLKALLLSRGVNKAANRARVLDQQKKRSFLKRKEKEQAKISEGVEVEAFLRTFPEEAARPQGRKRRAALFIVSLALFWLLSGGKDSLVFVLSLVAILMLHEGGHLLAMWCFGYRDLSVLFLPFFGAMAAGRKNDASAYEKVMISILGPLPGIILGVALMLALGPNPPAPLLTLIMGLIIINFLNLLPVVPLDGGHIMNILVFSRIPLLEAAFRIAGSLALIGMGVASDSVLLVLVAVAIILGTGTQWRMRRISGDLRRRLSGGLRQLSRRELLREIYHELHQRGPRKSPFRSRAVLAKLVADNALIESATGLQTLRLTLIYLLALVIAPAAFVSISLKSYWDQQTPPAVQLPAESPAILPGAAGVKMHAPPAGTKLI